MLLAMLVALPVWVASAVADEPPVDNQPADTNTTTEPAPEPEGPAPGTVYMAPEQYSVKMDMVIGSVTPAGDGSKIDVVVKKGTKVLGKLSDTSAPQVAIYQFTVKLNAAAKKANKKRKALPVIVTITVTPAAGGAPITKTLHVTMHRGKPKSNCGSLRC
jgi:hypothetical protein